MKKEKTKQKLDSHLFVGKNQNKKYGLIGWMQLAAT
jgi:hypothetical protein